MCVELHNQINRCLPALAELEACYRPGWNSDVIETEQQRNQREDWGIIKTALELLHACNDMLVRQINQNFRYAIEESKQEEANA